jgi:hypothetical protein
MSGKSGLHHPVERRASAPGLDAAAGTSKTTRNTKIGWKSEMETISGTAKRKIPRFS